MTRAWLVALAALALALGSSAAGAEELAKACDSNSDCSDGAWCVAGDAQTPVQRCVAGTPCGGASSGSCPADPSTGQLACIWRPDAKACSSASAGCKEIGGELGIYKCISLDRCDKYFGDAVCSGACGFLVGSVRAAGRGTDGAMVASRFVQRERRAVQWPRQLPGDVRERQADVQVRVRLGLERHQVRQRRRRCVQWPLVAVVALRCWWWCWC